jgi:hypothetical protein
LIGQNFSPRVRVRRTKDNEAPLQVGGRKNPENMLARMKYPLFIFMEEQKEHRGCLASAKCEAELIYCEHLYQPLAILVKWSVGKESL